MDDYRACQVHGCCATRGQLKTGKERKLYKSMVLGRVTVRKADAVGRIPFGDHFSHYTVQSIISAVRA